MAGGGSILDGQWAGSAFVLFLVQVVIIVAMSRFLTWVLKWIKQPAVVAEMLTGIVLGPTVMGRIPGFSVTIFPTASVSIIQVISNFALVFFMFIVGLELDPAKLRADAKLAVRMSLGGVIVPLIASCLLTFVFKDPAYSNTSFINLALFLTCALGMSALPVLARILSERRMLNTRIGSLAMTVAAVDDIFAYALLAVTLAVIRSSSQLGVLWTILLTIGEVVFVFGLVRPVIKWLVKRDAGHTTLAPDTFLVLSIILIACSYLAEVIGLSALIGAFQVGLIIPRNSNLSHHLSEKLEYFTVCILMPLYFTNSGLRTQFGLISDGTSVGYCVLVIAVATASKIIGIMIPAHLSQVPVRLSGIIGVLMSCKGLVALIVINYGLQAEIITDKFFAILVLMVLLTTMMTVPLMQIIDPPHKQLETQRMAIEWEDRMAVQAAADKAAADAKKAAKAALANGTGNAAGGTEGAAVLAGGSGEEGGPDAADGAAQAGDASSIIPPTSALAKKDDGDHPLLDHSASGTQAAALHADSASVGGEHVIHRTSSRSLRTRAGGSASSAAGGGLDASAIAVALAGAEGHEHTHLHHDSINSSGSHATSHGPSMSLLPLGLGSPAPISARDVTTTGTGIDSISRASSGRRRSRQVSISGSLAGTVPTVGGGPLMPHHSIHSLLAPQARETSAGSGTGTGTSPPGSPTLSYTHYVPAEEAAIAHEPLVALYVPLSPLQRLSLLHHASLGSADLAGRASLAAGAGADASGTSGGEGEGEDDGAVSQAGGASGVGSVLRGLSRRIRAGSMSIASILGGGGTGTGSGYPQLNRVPSALSPVVESPFASGVTVATSPSGVAIVTVGSPSVVALSGISESTGKEEGSASASAGIELPTIAAAGTTGVAAVTDGNEGDTPVGEPGTAAGTGTFTERPSLPPVIGASVPYVNDTIAAVAATPLPASLHPRTRGACPPGPVNIIFAIGDTTPAHALVSVSNLFPTDTTPAGDPLFAVPEHTQAGGTSGARASVAGGAHHAVDVGAGSSSAATQAVAATNAALAAVGSYTRLTLTWLLQNIEVPSAYMNTTESVHDIRDINLSTALDRSPHAKRPGALNIATYPSTKPLTDAFQEAYRRSASLLLCSTRFLSDCETGGGGIGNSLTNLMGISHAASLPPVHHAHSHSHSHSHHHGGYRGHSATIGGAVEAADGATPAALSEDDIASLLRMATAEKRPCHTAILFDLWPGAIGMHRILAPVSPHSRSLEASLFFLDRATHDVEVTFLHLAGNQTAPNPFAPPPPATAPVSPNEAPHNAASAGGFGATASAVAAAATISGEAREDPVASPNTQAAAATGDNASADSGGTSSSAASTTGLPSAGSLITSPGVGGPLETVVEIPTVIGPNTVLAGASSDEMAAYQAAIKAYRDSTGTGADKKGETAPAADAAAAAAPESSAAVPAAATTEASAAPAPPSPSAAADDASTAVSVSAPAPAALPSAVLQPYDFCRPNAREIVAAGPGAQDLTTATVHLLDAAPLAYNLVLIGACESDYLPQAVGTSGAGSVDADVAAAAVESMVRHTAALVAAATSAHVPALVVLAPSRCYQP